MRRFVLLGATFAALLAIIGASGVAVWRRAAVTQRDIARLEGAHVRAAVALGSIRSDIYLNGILVRDYLLDRRPGHAQEYAGQFLGIAAQVERDFRTLRDLASDSAQRAALDELSRRVSVQFDPTAVALDWSPAEKAARQENMLQQRLRGREEVLALAEQVEQMISANYAREQQRIRDADLSFRASLAWISATSFLAGLVIVGLSAARMLKLERESSLAAEDMRRLSAQVRATQEHERKILSRELHDQVGQMLTGLRLELGHMARIHDHANVELGSCIARSKAVAERTLEAIRNIAMMLRPPMLDDLGLSPALAWLVKELPKPSGLEVRAEIDPGVDRLPDAHRTCVYRVVQEALTNAVRHAKARKIRVSLTMDGLVLRGSVADDGRGFDPHSAKSRSEGLSVMAERIKELNGSIGIVSAPKHGVRIEFTLPCPISSGDHDDSDSASRRPRDNSSRIEASV